MSAPIVDLTLDTKAAMVALRNLQQNLELLTSAQKVSRQIGFTKPTGNRHQRRAAGKVQR